MTSNVNFSTSTSASVAWGRSQSTEGLQQTSDGRPSRPDPGQRLENDLAAAGVDAETASEIKSELETLFQESHAAGGPPSDALKESVNAIFEEHGLEASDFLRGPEGRGGPGGSRGPKGPPPSGGPSAANESSDVTSEEEDLLSILDKLAESESDPTAFAQLAVDVLYGVDEQA